MFSERQIYLISQQLLLSDLIAAQIKNHTGAKCHVVRKIDEITSLPAPSKTADNLHLIDCYGLNSYFLKNDLFEELSKLKGLGYYALFNLQQDLGIEKQALSLGVKGFFYINDRLETILRGIRLILEGELWASRKMITECLVSLPTSNRVENKFIQGLTKREVEILSLLAQGNQNETIADSLYISPHTVRTHLHHIFKKLKVKNRIQAAQWATNNL